MSSDGRELAAKGLSWSPEGLWVRRTADQQEMVIPFKSLAPADAKRALATLPFQTNDAIRLTAKSVSMTSTKMERETGNYIATASLYSYDGYHVRGHVSITPIKEKFRVSGRVVEVELSSIRGDGYAGLEFYAIRGSGSDREIYHSEVGVVKFLNHGSKSYFSAPETENLQGWVVIARSPNTGKIVQIVPSMSHLETFVRSRIPEKANIKVETKTIQQGILRSLDAE